MNSSSSRLPTSAICPNSAPSKSTLSNVASERIASKENSLSRESDPFSLRFASPIMASSGL